MVDKIVGSFHGLGRISQASGEMIQTTAKQHGLGAGGGLREEGNRRGSIGAVTTQKLNVHHVRCRGRGSGRPRLRSF